MEYPKSEMCDRFSIATLKKERIGEQCCIDEYNTLKKELWGYGYLEPYINRLYGVNKKIWDLESEIRKGLLDNVSLEEIGKRAIEIREWNKRRVTIKNEIVGITGNGFVDVKMNHISQ